MRVVVSGASGFIGHAIVRALQARGDQVTALTRNPQAARFDEGVQIARFDPMGAPDPSPFEGTDAVVHLAGETVAGRWTEKKKRAIYDSRVLGTRTVVDSIAASRAKAADPGLRIGVRLLRRSQRRAVAREQPARQ